jgi:xylulokinase
VVINGGQDHSCEALALGMTAKGAGLLACGTAWVINGIAETPSTEAIPASMDLNYHVVPGRWVVSQFLGGLGACLEWWLNQCSTAGTPDRAQAHGNALAAPVQGDGMSVGAQQYCAQKWTAFDEALEGTEPGCGGLLYLPQTGARQVPGSQQHGGFLGLRLDHSWADMGRAMLEGAAYELRWALEHLRAAGLALEQMWMVGGAAQSPLWPQIVADVSGLPVLLSQYTHGPALGAAILTGVGLGIFDSVEAARDHFQVSARRIEPVETHEPVYDWQYAAYRRLARELAL